jgi:hypothetical protein
MCRYAFKHYKSHFICFECRKTFKKAMAYDLARQHGELRRLERLSTVPIRGSERKKIEEEYGTTYKELMAHYTAMVSRCPQCGNQMADVGLDFKAPRKSDLRGWRILRDFYRQGNQWYTCGCNGPGFIPRNKSDYFLDLKAKKRWYLNRLAVFTTGKETASNPLEERQYWSSRLEAVNAELERVAKL